MFIIHMSPQAYFLRNNLITLVTVTVVQVSISKITQKILITIVVSYSLVLEVFQ